MHARTRGRTRLQANKDTRKTYPQRVCVSGINRNSWWQPAFNALIGSKNLAYLAATLPSVEQTTKHCSQVLIPSNYG